MPSYNNNIAFGLSTSPMGVMADEDDVAIKTLTTEQNCSMEFKLGYASILASEEGDKIVVCSKEEGCER
ncbi:hypothetical protein D8674_033930 [Pyrus ussuriensis x Pyrus communis]|uniref:Uncharacterized protein n=1 Tax=Pyrus ussuriensis x Pyrus communis TaxID=2448454 RepID=A0A5N5HMR1_9ROSA|nr:hypothetical protein D8674_033930 [Pyrus ussuriensis x Pyrus communis]